MKMRELNLHIGTLRFSVVTNLKNSEVEAALESYAGRAKNPTKDGFIEYVEEKIPFSIYPNWKTYATDTREEV